MKNRILALILTIAVTLGALCSCKLIFGDVAEWGIVTIVIENADGTYDVLEANLKDVENKQEGVTGVLEHLNKGKDKLHLEMTDGGYGTYVTAIGSIQENSAEGLYIMVYTSVSADAYVGGSSITYEDITLYYSGVGLSQMKVDAGTVILFRLEKYR